MSGKVVNIIQRREASTLRNEMEKAHTRLRMTPPHMDGDQRIRAVYSKLEPVWVQNEGVTVTLVEKFDYRQLVNPTYEHISFFQVRENNTLTERVEKNNVRFFGQSPEALQKAPIIFKFVDDNEETVHAAIMGNGRGYCFKAQNSENSFQPAIVVEFPPGTSTASIFNYAFEAASESNTKLTSDVDTETKGDIVQQLRTKYRGLQLSSEEEVTKEEAIPILLEWLTTKPDYSKPEQSVYRSTLVNEALQYGRSDPTPAATSSEIDQQWSEFFGVAFNLKNTVNVDKEIGKGFANDIERSLYLKWKDAPDSRKPCWLVARVGAVSGQPVTSIQSVNNRRTGMMKYFADMNTNSKRVKGAHQLITRVMFQKQLTDPSNKCIAFEWCPDSEEFIEKSS